MSFIEKTIDNTVVIMPLSSEHGELIKLTGDYIEIWNLLKNNTSDSQTEKLTTNSKAINEFIKLLNDSSLYFNLQAIDFKNFANDVKGEFSYFNSAPLASNEEVLGVYASGPSNGTDAYGGSEPCPVPPEPGGHVCE